MTASSVDSLYGNLPMLESERVRLEPLEPRHADGLFAIYSDAAVMRCLGEKPHQDIATTEREIRESLRAHEQRTAIHWCIVLRNESLRLASVACTRCLGMC